MTDQIVFDSLRKLNGTYRGAHQRLISAGDGFVKQLEWACKHGHGTRKEAEDCAKENMIAGILVDTLGQDGLDGV